MTSFIQLSYRTARNLRVVPYNRLSTQIIKRFHLTNDTRSMNQGGFGYAICTKGKQVIQEIDQDSALLLLCMKSAGKLPTYLLESENIDIESCLSELILCELLEAKWGNVFITGMPAINAIKTSSNESLIEINPMAEVSHAALNTAIDLGLLNQPSLSNFLYSYNLIPANRQKRQLLENDKSYLQLSKVDKYWLQHDSVEGWYYFENSQSRPIESKYKLYISPTPSYLAQTLQKTALILKSFEHVSFKVGKGTEGILRPDKLVAYFDSLDTLMEAAKALKDGLGNTPAHPVPFTALYDENGLITWGMDPKAEGKDRQSWRQWIIEKLVGSILLTSEEDTKCQTALERLKLEGINPSTFRPGATWIKQYS